MLSSQFFLWNTQLCKFTFSIPNSALDLNENYEITHATLDPYEVLLLEETSSTKIASDISSLFFKASQDDKKFLTLQFFVLLQNDGKNVNLI